MPNLDNFLGGLLKILKEECKGDIQLKAGLGDSDKAADIFVHKIVLAERSEVFKRMFESDEFKTSDGLKTLTLSDMNQEELEAFVEFIYSNGSLSSPKLKKHVKSLYMAAYKYDIPHLSDLCIEEMINSLNTSNALEFLEIYSGEPFGEAALDFITENLWEISQSSEFKLFVRRKPVLAVEIMQNAGFLIDNGYL